MKIIKGTIREIDIQNRIFEVVTKEKVESLYVSRSLMNRFKPYIQTNFYCEVECSDASTIREDTKTYEVITFTKIIGNKADERQVFYDINKIRESLTELINKNKCLMFIDLEFSMPPYGYHKTFESEIVQYGYIVTQDLQIVEEGVHLVLPKDINTLSDRTFDFLKKDIEDFYDAISPIEFYNKFKELIDKYEPMIIVWGTNDILVINDFYKLHELTPLTKRASFINLMQIIKNYFGLKNDIGLFNALSFFDANFNEYQEHDALQDAFVTYKVYELFLKHCSNK